MKFNRRAMFGFMGGAAVAGPRMAQSFASGLAAGMPAPDSPAMGYTTAAKLASEGDWRISRIAELKRIISGQNDDPYEKQYRQRRISNYLEQAERHRLDTLRSIAPSHKVMMIADGEMARRQRMQIIEAEWELERMENEPLNIGNLLRG